MAPLVMAFAPMQGLSSSREGDSDLRCSLAIVDNCRQARQLGAIWVVPHYDVGAVVAVPPHVHGACSGGAPVAATVAVIGLCCMPTAGAAWCSICTGLR